jgi:phosphatidate phosphatase APP1
MLGRPTLVVVRGRALATSPEDHPGASAAEQNVRRLTAKSAEGRAVVVTFAGQARRVTAGDDGFFEAAFAAPADRPFAAGLASVQAEGVGAAVEGQVQVVSDAAPFLLITDLDDTLAVTNVASKRALARAALRADAATTPAVPGMAPFLRCVLEGTRPAAGAVVVSGSPVELAPRIQRFLALNGFPFAALSLRHLGPRTLSGYKEPALRALLSGFPQAVVLVGDSGERDPEIYAALRAEFPGRVAAIFIRDAGGPADPGRFDGMFLFREPGTAAREAAAIGLADLACVERAFGGSPPAGAPPAEGAAVQPTPPAVPADVPPAPPPPACPPCPCPCTPPSAG